MKKTLFTALRAMCVGAMTLFAVSCYDDSALREDLAGLEDEVAGLAARLDSLENVLNDDVKNLNELESAMTDLEEALAEALQESGVDLKKAFEQELADIEKELAAAIAKGDQANADALAAEKKEIEEAMLLLAEGFAEGFTTMGSSVEELAAALAALNTLVGDHTELLKALDEKDGVLDGRIENLETAVADLTAAGQTLQAEVAKALAKVSVTNVEKTGNTIVITFSDGNSVELSAPLANVDNNGLVNIVEVDGVKYWNVIGADTHTGVVVGHPDVKIEFQINGETNELEYKVNDGEWTSTGVAVEATAANVKVITAFEETDEYVKLTIGGTDVVLPKYVNLSAAAFDRNGWYVPYGATRTVNLTVVEGHEYYVTSKPDGWKAVLEGSVLTVTAPAEELITMGAAEMLGEVLVHADADNGACKIVKLDVTAGPAMTLSYNDGNLTFFNASLTYTVDEMYGDVWVEFADAWFGLIPIDEFVKYESFDAYMKTQPESISNLHQILFNQFQEEHFESGKDEFEATWSLKEIVDNSWSGFELDENETYLMWVAPQGTAGLDYDKAFYVVTGEYVDFKVTEALATDVLFEATFYGADNFVVGATSKSAFDEWGIGEDFTYEDALLSYLMGSRMPGPLPQFAQGNLEAMGKVYDSGNHVADLSSAVLPDMGYRAPITADTILCE